MTVLKSGAPYPGPRNSLTDVAGLLVGNAQDVQVRSGTTVVLCEPGLRATAAVQVRGGGPGTRETDVLAPGGLVGSVDAVVLSGGSAYGLDAAGSVHAWLGSQDRGYDVGNQRIPIVSSAILYDLSHAGDKNWGEDPPYRRLGREAALAAGQDFALGKAGAGYGARAGSLEGGLGSASAVDPVTGATVAAVVAVNSFGETTGDDGLFFAAPFERNGEFGGLGPSPNPANPSPVFAKLDSGIAAGRTNTTIAVVATDARLTHEDTHRVAVMAEAGFARAIRPIFTPYDGDTVFVLSTGRGPAVDLVGLCRLGAIASDCLARAIARGVYEATATTDWPVWCDRYAAAR